MQDETRMLWCLIIDGDSSAFNVTFNVTVPASLDVSDLKELVWEKVIDPKTGILAKDLTLLKVRVF